MRFLFTLIICLILPFPLSAVDNESDVITLGPLKVKPGEEKDLIQFCVPNLQDSFTLEILNGGPNGEGRLTALNLLINGEPVLDPDEINPSVASLSIPITDLSQINTLATAAMGPRDGFATLTLRSSPFTGPRVFGPILQIAGTSESHTFQTEHPDAVHVLRFVNGDPTLTDPRQRLNTMVLKAEVLVDGQPVFTTKDFEKAFQPPLNPVLTAEVAVQAESVISITMGGENETADKRFASTEIISTVTGPPVREVTIASGNLQSGPVDAVLPEPIVAQLVNGSGTPVPNEVVFFKVTSGTGLLLADGSTVGSRLVGVLTDSNGFAWVNWKLGIGAGEETLSAYVQDHPDEEVVFEAQSLGLGAAALYGESGFNQMGIVGTPLMHPFKMLVTDRFGNPVPNQPIEARVLRGDGLINGESEITILTNNAGMAQVHMTLGRRPGFQNHVVEAAIPGLPGPSVQFSADACLPGDPSRTSLTVRVLNQDRKPLEGAEVSLVGGSLTATTDARGYFTLMGIPSGVQAIHVDAHNISNDPATYPHLTFESVPIVAGNDNTMPTPIFLTALDVANAVPIPPDQPVLFATPRIPGLLMGVAAGNAVFPAGVPEEIHITPVDNSRIPMPLPEGSQSRLVVTIQPSGLAFKEPAPISFPNVDGLEPGEKTTIYSFDHDVGAYVSQGTATVSEDGQTIVSDPGSGIRKGGWHAVATLIDCNNSLATFKVQYPDGSPAPGASVTIQGRTVKSSLDGTAQITVSSCRDAESDVEQDIPPEPEDEDDPKINPDQENDPVLLHSGEYVYNLSFLEIPGRGLNYVFKLRYESRSKYNGPVGHGWMHNFDKRLYQESDGDLRRVDGKGRVDVWKKLAGHDAYAAPSGFYSDLFTDDNGEFCIRQPNGVREIYSPVTGYLKEIRDRNGNRLRFRYDSRHRLIGVLDPLDREIIYEYNAEDRLAFVRDFMGRTVTLIYDGNGDLIKATGPAVTNTPNGNDFPNGKTCQFTYSSGFSNENLNHNMLTVTKPNEVELSPPGPPYLTNIYDDQDRVSQQHWGGTSASGVAAGGLIGYQYNTIPAMPDPDDFNTAIAMTAVTDRNGNLEEHYFNQAGNMVRLSEKTNRNVNPNDPDEFVTVFQYNKDGERTRQIKPEGNILEFIYDDANPQRNAHGNITEIHKIPDAARGGDQDVIITRTIFEPVYNQAAREIDARGIDPNFQPPTGGPTSQERYTHEYIFDYQEGNQTAALATEAGITEEALIQLLNERGIEMNLGDVNGDGRTDGLAGNVIERRLPLATLLAGSHHATIEGGLQQRVVNTAWFNDRGQIIKSIDPEGNVTLFEYYPENDPDGDGELTPGFTSKLPRGYLKRRIQDAELHPRRRETAAPVEIKLDYEYDPAGNVVAEVDGRGVRTQHFVNQLNQTVLTLRASDVSAVPGRNGGVDGQSEDLDGQDYQYQIQTFYDANNNVVEVRIENRDGFTEEMGEAPGFIEKRFAYDILDNPISRTEETDVGQTRVTQFRYDSNQNPIAVILPEGNIATRAFDERDLKIANTTGDNNQNPYDEAPEPASTIRFTYDKNRNLIGKTDAEDQNNDGENESAFTFYDGFDRVIRVLDAVGGETRYHYDPAGNMVEMEKRGRNGGPSPESNDPTQNVLLARSFFKRDELSRIYQVDHALFSTPGLDYNHGPVLADGPLSDGDARVSLRAEFDRNSRITHRIEDDLDLVIYHYDGANRLIRIEDGEDNERLNAYDDNSNLARSTQIDRSPEGRVAPETFVTLYSYDALNRTTRIVDTLGQTRRFQYDSRDNPIGVSDAEAGLSGETAFTTQTVPLNLPGNTRRQYFDALGRLIRTEMDMRQNGQGDQPLDLSQGGGDGVIATTREYDLNSRLVARTDDNGNRTAFIYDELNRLIRQRFADQTETRFQYDRDHNMIGVWDANGSVRTAFYDGVNRLVRTEIFRGPGVLGSTLQEYEYDGLHRNTMSADNNDPDDPNDDARVVRKYDSLSRVLEEVQNDQTVASDWFAEGLRIGLIYPNGREVNYTYDAVDRLKSISDNPNAIASGLVNPLPGGNLVEYDYIGPDRILEARLGNNHRRTHLNPTGDVDVGYDSGGRLVSMRFMDNTDSLIAGFEYGFNRENHRLYERRIHGPPLKGGDQLKYDSTYRATLFKRDLPEADVGDPNAATEQERREYNLDGAGNWIDLTITNQGQPQQTSTQTIDEMNAYAEFNGVTRTHDEDGNLVDDGRNHYSYDFLNRLVQVKRKSDNQVIARYAYDCLGRRTQRVVAHSGDLNTHLRYYYDGYRVIEEQNQEGITTQQYVDGLDLDDHVAISRNADLSADNSTEQTLFLHNDVRGGAAVLTDESGTVLERYTYDLFGHVRFEDPFSSPLVEQRQSLHGNPYAFHGRRLDPETGFYYHRNRHYDPQTGRYLQRDPGGPWFDPLSRGNPYAYGALNPWSYNDPMGESAMDMVSGFVDGAGEGAWDFIAGSAEFAWDALWHPIDSVTGMVDGMKALLDQIMAGDFLEAAKTLYPELYTLVMKWDSLSDYDRGNLVGKILAEEGAGVLTGAGAAKILGKLKKAKKVSKLKKLALKEAKSSGSLKDKMKKLMDGGYSQAEAAELIRSGEVCFAPGTLIITQEGLKPIETIEAGDLVLSKDDQTGQISYQKVLRTFQTRPASLCHIAYETADGQWQTLLVTAEHPFWLANVQSWTPAGFLKPGDQLLLAHGQRARVLSINREATPLGFIAYNFEVEDTNTYFAGPAETGSWEDAAWVHNFGKKCNSTKKKPYSNPRNRPKYAPGQVEEVWRRARDYYGDVYDPHTGEDLGDWKPGEPREWDMGHKPGFEYNKLHKKYMSGEITKDEFLFEYRNPDNYWPESRAGNQSHIFED